MLIGLHGKARSGKDTAYRFIKEWAESEGRPVRRDAFADRLKLSAARALGFKGELADAVAFCNDLKEDRLVGFTTQSDPGGYFDNPMAFITGREYLQFYGTEAHREVFGQSFWIDAVMRTYDSSELLVITDVRFPNEAEAVRAAGGEIWQILRVRNVEISGDHASERPLPTELIDHTIFNDYDLDHLRDLVLSRVERLVSV